MRLRNVILILLLFFGAAFCSWTQAEEPTYTRSASLPPIRITYSDLQQVLDKSVSLMSAANAPYETRPITERLQLKHEEFQVELREHKLQGSNVKLPKLATELEYTAYASSLDKVPVSTVSLSFYDYDRKLIVKGQSPEQVDALFALLKSDFLGLSSSFGGLSFRNYTGSAVFAVCLWTVLAGLLYWLSTRRMSAIFPAFLALISLGLLFLLPFRDFLAGFSVSEFDPSFGSRYAATISLWGFVIALLGIPLSYVLPLWLGKRSTPGQGENTVTPNKIRRSRAPRS